MTTLQLLIVCATTIAVAGIIAAVRMYRPAAGPQLDSPPPRVGHRVTVHTKKPDDQTIFGVCVGDYLDRLVLEDAEYVTATGGKPIPGRQDIATRDVAWIDVHDLVALPLHLAGTGSPVGADEKVGA